MSTAVATVPSTPVASPLRSSRRCGVPPIPTVLNVASPLRSLRRCGGTPAFAFLLSLPVLAQTPYPPAYIRNVVWNEGPHYITVPQPIIAPGYELEPTTITGTTHTEFISATEVRLTPGFHAGGFSAEGRFRAHIDLGLGDPSDVIVIAPENAVSEADNRVHVPKWEKLEVGLKLPEDFEAAVASFFENYYPYPGEPTFPNNVNAFTSNPSNTDALHDLNPYADDSLQVFLVLTDPNGEQRIKHGFYMKEVKWLADASSGDALTADDTAHPLDAYRIRFRFAPDMEGTWQFWLGLRAPHTLDANDAPLVPLTYVGYGFVCDPPLPEKHGPLHVNQANRRILQHEDGTPYFALGTNLPDVFHSEGDFLGYWGTFYQRDMEVWKETMDKLHSVGGNFLRMWLFKNLLSTEWGNLGVYDAYRLRGSCVGDGLMNEVSNCQFQCWSFDQLMEHAALNNIYLQLCVDPSYPSGWASYLWGKHPYVASFLEPQRDPVTGLLDARHYFYTYDPPDPETGVRQLDEGVFYYWKRRYKYILSRWGYSPHLAILEPFNEIDQTLGYKRQDLTQVTNNGDVCPENRLVWPINEGLPETISDWLTDLTDFVRGEQNISEPWRSPLGEDKLFLMSYTPHVASDRWDRGNWDDPNDDIYRPNYFAPLENDRVDLVDVHKGLHPDIGDQGEPDVGMKVGFDHANSFWNDPAMQEKPFNHGEYNHYTDLPISILPNAPTYPTDKFFHNYDVSFHNELWSGAFSGKFAAGTTWHQERVFWWEDGVVRPEGDDDNPFNAPGEGQFTNEEGMSNTIKVNGSDYPIENQSLYHHFKPLTDLLNDQGWLSYGFFSGNYSPHRVFDETPLAEGPDDLESYYLMRKSNDPDEDRNLAIGWVHNRNAWTMNNFYLTSSVENFFGCQVPTPATAITLTGFADNTEVWVTWFPTRWNSTVVPAATPIGEPLVTDDNGFLTINFEPNQFGSILNNYMDTLRTDYAFIITPEPFLKRRRLVEENHEATVSTGWDFGMYPNPASEEIFLRLPDGPAKVVELLDVSGRTARALNNVSATNSSLALKGIAKGLYWVRVSDGANSKAHKLIIH